MPLSPPSASNGFVKPNLRGQSWGQKGRLGANFFWKNEHCCFVHAPAFFLLAWSVLSGRLWLWYVAFHDIPTMPWNGVGSIPISERLRYIRTAKQPAHFCAGCRSYTREQATAFANIENGLLEARILDVTRSRVKKVYCRKRKRLNRIAGAVFFVCFLLDRRRLRYIFRFCKKNNWRRFSLLVCR